MRKIVQGPHLRPLNLEVFSSRTEHTECTEGNYLAHEAWEETSKLAVSS